MVPAPPSLAAVLIVRDEARCIARCLASVRAFVDRIAVVDTGSRDETPAIAAALGARVHHLAWPGDFSAARNHALACADADWALVIDADEWITQGGESLRGWCAAGAARIGAVCIHSSFDTAGAARPGHPPPAGRNWLPRLLPRGVRYEGRIHEQPVAGDLPCVRTALHLGHDGYMEAQAIGKRARNLPLLLAEQAARPDDPYILYQLGTEAESRRDHAEATRHYARALALTPADANWRHALVVRHLHCLGQCGESAAALDLAGQEITAWPDSPDLFFVLGNLLLDQAVADPARAIRRWLPLAQAAWERCLAIGERPDLEGSVHGRGSHLARYNLAMMREQMALLQSA